MKKYIQINKRIYDDLADEYAYRRDNKGEFSESTEYLGSLLLKYAGEMKNGVALEVGPGAGQILGYFEKKGLRTVGVELSEKMCELCKRQSPNSLIINDDINNLNFSCEQFDLIYMGAIIHLFPLSDAVFLMKKIREWLKPNGYIFINTTCNPISKEGYFEKKDYTSMEKRFRRYWKEEDFKSFVENSGFKIIDALYTDEKDKEKMWVAYIACKEF